MERLKNIKPKALAVAVPVLAGAAVGMVGINNAFADGASITFGVEVPSVPVLEIVLYDGSDTSGDTIADGGAKTMTVTPQMATAGFNSSDVTVSVGTSNAAGYKLEMYASNTSLTSSGNTIATLGSGNFTCTAETAANCNFTVNRWGYKKSTDENYISVPAQADAAELNSNDAPVNADPTTINFGSRVDASQPAGLYTTTINFVATANVNVVPITGLTNMQDAANFEAGAVCDASAKGDTAVLTDIRDNQSYTVKKLEDDKCWMMNNLNLGDTANHALAVTNLDSTNTNLAEGASPISAATFTSWKKTSGTGTYTSAEYITVSGTDSVSGDPYNTLYNYCATSAGTMCADQYSTATNAQSSLCPAGWRLPTGGANSDFTALSVAYGGLATTMNASSNPTGATMQNILRTQLKMTFAGSFYNSTPANQGSYGYYWSSTWRSATYMYGLSLYATTVYPTGGNGRDFGYSIRCVLQ